MYTRTTIKKGDTYKGGQVISIATQGATTRGAYGMANLPVRKEYIGRQYVIVQFSDRSTHQYWL